MMAPHLTIALLALAACAAPHQREAPLGRGDRLVVAGALPRSATMDAAALEALGAEDMPWAHHGESSTYRCVRLDKVLTACGLEAGTGGPDADPRTKHIGWRRVVVATAGDGFQGVFSSAEILPDIGPSRVFVAWAVNGRPLDAAEGPLRLLVPTDHKGSRSLRRLVRVDVLPAPVD